MAPVDLDLERLTAPNPSPMTRGGSGTVLHTHDHGDHADGVDRLGVQVSRPADGQVIAGLRAIVTPGHADEHLCFVAGSACFTGDLILGQGSTIVGPRDMGGSLLNYMESLRKLEELELDVLYPGHGPEVHDPAAKIAEYIAHRQQREDRLVAALDRGERRRPALLAEVWNDVPEQLRPAAAIAMQAHLEKLDDEGRLPGDLSD